MSTGAEIIDMTDGLREKKPKAYTPEILPGRPIHEIEELPQIMKDAAQFFEDSGMYDLPTISHAAALCLFAVIVGKRFHGAGRRQVNTNLFVTCVANSGAGKDAARDGMAVLLRECGGKHLLGGDDWASDIGIYDMFAEIVGDEIDPPLRYSAPRLVLPDEWGTFLRAVGSKNAAPHQKKISKVLREAFYWASKTAYVPTKAGGQLREVSNASLTIYSTTTPEQFVDGLSGSDVVDGLLNRFLIFRHDGPLVEQKDDDDAAGKIPTLLKQDVSFLIQWCLFPPQEWRRAVGLGEDEQELLGGYTFPVSFAIPVSKGAKLLFKELDREVMRRRQPMIDRGDRSHACFVRTVEKAKRIATTCAAVRDPMNPMTAIINEREARIGCEIALRQDCVLASLADGVSDDADGAARQRILKIIRESDGGVKRTPLSNRSHMDKKKLNDVLATLEDAGLIRIETYMVSGRTFQKYFAL